MCLIIFCPKGVSKKSEFLTKAIETAAITNDDGMGFMYKEEGNITFKKGFTSTQDLLQAIDAINPTDEGLLAIHLRIGNKGAKNDKMCHPFVCSNDEEELLSLEGQSDKPVLVHNGTFMGITLEKELSDTAMFARDYMSIPSVSDLFYNYTSIFKDLFSYKLSVSRLLVFFPGNSMDFQKVGTWVEDQGYFFSNESYKSSRIRDIGGLTTHQGRGGRGSRQSSMRFPERSERDRYQEYRKGRYGDDEEDTQFSASLASSKRFNNSSNNSRALNIISNTHDEQVIKNYKRKTRIDCIGGQGGLMDRAPLNQVKTLVDELDFDYKVYKGMILRQNYLYISDIVSLEYVPNHFNYDILTLQAKISDPNHKGLLDGAYYVIKQILKKQDTNEFYFKLERKVNAAGNDTITIPAKEVNLKFSVKPASDAIIQNYFDAFHDILMVGNSSNAKQRDYLKLIKDKKDDEIVNIKGLGNFPVKAIKWFVYQTRMLQGKSETATIAFIKK